MVDKDGSKKQDHYSYPLEVGPPQGTYKLNSNGAVKNHPGIGEVGGVFRNHLGSGC